MTQNGTGMPAAAARLRNRTRFPHLIWTSPTRHTYRPNRPVFPIDTTADHLAAGCERDDVIPF